ncbi:hypothetical protein TELCIR_00445 [Teladorsagia circumcincta]|uniref:Surfactant protein B n=1 Tax=Teladorsagia circumcincta TaxID=45464 RepID=A0A2G9V627_TELCI|nr:hypothetical protein TELCIR_00445 [Teladorsagia circumcincta]
MKILFLLAILTTQLFLTSFCFDCKIACKECMLYMTATKYYVQTGNAKAVEKEMRKDFCTADPKKPEYSCLMKPCAKIKRIVAHLKKTTTPEQICKRLTFC